MLYFFLLILFFISFNILYESFFISDSFNIYEYMAFTSLNILKSASPLFVDELILTNKLVLDFQPSELILELSKSLAGVPSGLVLSYLISPLYPTTFLIRFAISNIDNSNPASFNTLTIFLLNYKYKSVDDLKESDFKGNLREYLESNSFFYKNFRFLKAKLYLSFNIQKGANIVNKKGVVYGERSKKKFINYKEFQSDNGINKLFFDKYVLLLNTLTNKVREQNAIPVYITQTSGYGINSELFSASVSVMEHCKNQNLECINLAKEIDLNYDDFYDELHLNPKGSLKVFSYLSKKLEKIIN